MLGCIHTSSGNRTGSPPFASSSNTSRNNHRSGSRPVNRWPLGISRKVLNVSGHPDASQQTSDPAAASGGYFQIFVEPIQRALPGFLGCSLVVTGRRVVVESVIGALVYVAFMRDPRRSQCGIKIRPTRGDTGIEFTILRI